MDFLAQVTPFLPEDLGEWTLSLAVVGVAFWCLRWGVPMAWSSWSAEKEKERQDRQALASAFKDFQAEQLRAVSEISAEQSNLTRQLLEMVARSDP